jgi:mannosyl-3-phosphoglycerate phosphatase
VPYVGFSDMTVGDVAEECGLPVLDAQLAKLREFDEPFRLLDPDPALRSRFLKALHKRGLKAVSGGRYDHVTGNADKGRAVVALRSLIPDRVGPVVLAGLGDGFNDVSMLREVDLPVIVRSDMNGAAGRMLRKVPTAHVTDACGPAGWAEAVTSLLDGWRDDAPRTKTRHWLG